MLQSVDVKRSTKLVMEYHKEFLYNELTLTVTPEKPTRTPTESMQVGALRATIVLKGHDFIHTLRIVPSYSGRDTIIRSC
jgi:hypothetical protein